MTDQSNIFQSGDSKRLKWILHNYPWTMGKENCEMLRRFLTEAEKCKPKVI